MVPRRTTGSHRGIEHECSAHCRVYRDRTLAVLPRLAAVARKTRTDRGVLPDRGAPDRGRFTPVKPKTMIGIVLLAGAGIALWMYVRARAGLSSTGIIPQPSGFNYAGATEPFRSSDGKTIIGGAVPRSTTTTTTAAPAPAPYYDPTVPQWGTL